MFWAMDNDQVLRSRGRTHESGGCRYDCPGLRSEWNWRRCNLKGGVLSGGFFSTLSFFFLHFFSFYEQTGAHDYRSALLAMSGRRATIPQHTLCLAGTSLARFPSQIEIELREPWSSRNIFSLPCRLPSRAVEFDHQGKFPVTCAGCPRFIQDCRSLGAVLMAG